MGKKIRVTPEYLLQRKEEWTFMLKQAESAFLEGMDYGEKLEQYLSGSPVKEAERQFRNRKEEGIKAFKVLKARLVMLGDIGTVYESAEGSNKNVAPEN